MSHIESYSAVKLFAERARQVQRNFSLEDERECVARVSRLVEGMPLGIELAAGWLKRLSCADIADEIERNLDFLATNLRGIPDRHRSIRAVFAHSWQLLSEEEQAVFMKLSVFRGGCTREAAEAVTDTSLYLLSDLVDKSLLRLNSDGRYDIHELLRQYAKEKLAEVPDIREKVLDRHCDYFMDLVAIQESDLFYGWKQSPQIGKVIKSDKGNLLQTWQYAIVHRKLFAIQKALASLCFSYRWYETKHLLPQTIDLLRTDEPYDEQSIAFGFALIVYGTSDVKLKSKLSIPRKGLDINTEARFKDVA